MSVVGRRNATGMRCVRALLAVRCANVCTVLKVMAGTVQVCLTKQKVVLYIQTSFLFLIGRHSPVNSPCPEAVTSFPPNIVN